MTDDAGQTTSQSGNMVKSIISKGLGLGGARIFTVGAGVILSAMLWLAAATPLTAQIIIEPNNPWVLVLRHEPDFGSTVTPDLGVRVRTTWELDRPGRCPEPLKQELYRRTGSQTKNPGELIWQGKGYTAPRFRHYLKLNTEYQYHLFVTCPPLDEGHLYPGVTEAPFGFRILEDDRGPAALWPTLYRGTWVTRQGKEFSGGSTHEARQDQSSATIGYNGLAMAWLTTSDAKPSGDQDQARVACDRRLCATVSTAVGSVTKPRRVMSAGWLSVWGHWSTQGPHRLQVIADDNEGVDVDAFLLVEDCAGFFAQCN